MSVNLYPFLSQGGFYMLNKKLIKLTSIEAALFLSDLISKREYFRQNGDLEKTGGWFYNSQKNIELDTTLSPKQQTGLVKKLKQKNYLIVKKVGLPAVNHYFINDSVVLNDIMDEYKLPEAPIKSSREKKELLAPTKVSINNNTLIKTQSTILDVAKEISLLPNKVLEEKELAPIDKIDSYKNSVDFWLKEFHVGFTFGGAQGKALKSILKKIKEVTGAAGNEPTEELIANTFRLICENLPDWYKEKDLNVIDSKFNEIILEIKNKKNGTAKEKPRSKYSS